MTNTTMMDEEDVMDDVGGPDTFSLSRSHALQRSQDSGAVTDWSRDSPTRHSSKSQDSLLSQASADRVSPARFVTVLSVNDAPSTTPPPPPASDYVTVLSIGRYRTAFRRLPFFLTLGQTELLFACFFSYYKSQFLLGPNFISVSFFS